MRRTSGIGHNHAAKSGWPLRIFDRLAWTEPKVYFTRATASVRGLALLLIFIQISAFSSQVLAQEPAEFEAHPLLPVDTSSPRDTLTDFLDNIPGDAEVSAGDVASWAVPKTSMEIRRVDTGHRA